MSNEPKFYFIKPPGLPATEAKNLLGRVVKNYASPSADYTPNGVPQDLVQFPAPPLRSGTMQAQAILGSSRKVTATALVTIFSEFTHTHGQEDTLAFASESIEVTRLQQHTDTFDKLKAVPEVQEKLAKMIRIGGKAYFIVGLLVWKNARYSTHHQSTKGTGVVGKLPLDAALAAATGGIPLPVGSVELGRARETTASSTVSGHVDGEQIIGLEYRLIRRGRLGLGSTTSVSSSAVRYEGGRFYGETDGDNSSDGEKDNDDEDEDDEVDEDDDPLWGVSLTDEAVEGCDV